MKRSMGSDVASLRWGFALTRRRERRLRALLIRIFCLCGLSLVALLASQAASANPGFSVNPGAVEQPTGDESKRGGGVVRGDGIVVATGNKTSTEQDFAVDEAMGLYLQRTYNHHWNGIGLFGKHWLSNFDYSLAFSNGAAWAQRPDGRRIKFLSAGAGRWNEDKAQPVAYLVQNADGSYTLYNEERGTETYSAAGYLIQRRDEQGVTWTFSYNGTYLQRVTHSSGRSVQFAWANGQVTQVTDPAGSVYQYAYTPDVFGTGRGRLAGATLPGAPATTVDYHYEDGRFAGALTGTSVNGVRTSTFAYDDQARAIRSEGPGGVERYTFNYVVEDSTPVPLPPPPPPPGGFQRDQNGEDERAGCVYWTGGGKICYQVAAIGVAPMYGMASLAVAAVAAVASISSTQVNPTRMRVTETSPLERRTVYGFENGRLVSIESGSKVGARTYDANGYLNLVHDFEDGITDFDYDEHGHLTRKVEAVGASAARTTTFVWDEAKNRLLQETVVGQSETTYTYTSDGRVATASAKNLSTHGAAGQVQRTAYAYNAQPNGLLISQVVDGPVSGSVDAVTYAYDAAHFLASVRNGAGQSTTFASYNGLGQPGRITGPNGAVTEYTYDARGRITLAQAIVNGVAQPTTYAYDGFGRLASMRTPDGVTITQVYDAAGRVLRQFRSDGKGAFEQVRYSHNAASQVTAAVTESAAQVDMPATLPGVPQGLSAPGVNETGSYTVQWSVVSGATAYRLEESVNGGAWKLAQDAASTSLALTGKSAATTFAYRVRACNAAGCGGTASPITVQPPVYGAQFIGQSVPASMAVGKTYAVTVQMKNTGNVAWTGVNGYRLGSQNPGDNTRWGTSRVAVPGTVAPGAVASFTFNVVAPATGANAFQWQMARDGGGTWFGDLTPIVAVTTLSGWISASPNPCAIPGGGSTCTSTISWGASVGGAEVWVTDLNNSGSQLFYGNTQNASAPASWITASGNRFHLKKDGLTLATVDVRGQLTAHAAQFVSHSVPTVMLVGQPYPANVTVKNTGAATWTNASGFHLGSQNPLSNTNWGASRVAVAGQVATNQNATFNFTARAPTTAGNYNFQWQMVHDGVTWFGPTTPNVPVTVLSGWINAGPNPCTIAAGASTCSATISWGASHAGAEVWVTNLDGSMPQLFVGNTQSGSAAASWIPTEGKRFHLKRSGLTLATVDVRGQLTPHGAQFLWQSVPSSMVAGQWYQVQVALRNTGALTWNSWAGFHLGSRWPYDNTRWGMSRVPVPGDWSTNQDRAITFSVRAPDQPGTHNFEWQMVQDGVTWFGDTTPYVPVTVMNGWISASPNPCTIPYGGSTCTASISWGASHGGAEIWVTDLNNNGAQLFYGNTQSGSASASWIGASGNRFHLKKNGLTLATVDVRGNPTTQPPPDPPKWTPPTNCPTRNCYEP
ncbi:DUF6531 domain-containing protein [Lysobacter sp. GCM10012299]|uniref:DUF6531 domain-containing protein n=1 Tax=Lysobacter sp. GCM10012299 TaxID=3317333 RepID=UPI00361DD22A